MLNKTKTLTAIAIQKKAKEKALKWTNQNGNEPYEKPLGEEQSRTKCSKKKSSDRRMPS